MAKSKNASPAPSAPAAAPSGVDDAVLPEGGGVEVIEDGEADAVEVGDGKKAAPSTEHRAPSGEAKLEEVGKTAPPKPTPDKAAALVALEKARANAQAVYDFVQAEKKKLEEKLDAAQAELRAAKRFYNDIPS